MAVLCRCTYSTQSRALRQGLLPPRLRTALGSEWTEQVEARLARRMMAAQGMLLPRRLKDGRQVRAVTTS